MFLISKLLTWLFLTPLLFIIPLILCLILIRKNKIVLAFILLTITTLLLSFMSLRIGHDLILNPLETKIKQTNLATAKPEYIIILGGGIINKSGENHGKPTLSDSTSKRVIAGYKLWRKNKKAKLIVCGGTPLKNGVPEAKVMAEELIAFGVEPKLISCESHSRNTFENIKYAIRLTKSNKKNTYLVTTAMHMPRTMAVCKKIGLKVIPVLCDYRIDQDKQHWYDAFPQYPYLSDSFAAVKEYIGIIYYKTFYKVL